MSTFFAITKADAAKQTGLSVDTIKQALRSGELVAIRIMGRVFVDQSSLEPFMANRRERHDAQRVKASAKAGKVKRLKQWQKLQQ